jgi:hypothetical protein
MNEAALSYRVDPLREMIGQFDMVIRGFRERTGARIAGTVCDVLPAEITASLGLVPVRVPLMAGRCCVAAGLPDIGDIGGIYDFMVLPRGCAGRGGAAGLKTPVLEFSLPAGWGEEACREMALSLDALLRAAGCGGTSSIDAARLRAVTAEYNALRRLVRGIGSLRNERPGLLSCGDLGVVHEAAAIFPPGEVAGHLASLLEAMNAAGSSAASRVLPVLVYAGFTDGAVLDELEEAGCRVVEDDACGGRRQFDMSYNHELPDLFGEILDAFSYRPRCPSVRTVAERVELFYTMMKGHGIELVVFIEDRCCPARLRDIEALRVRLMRSGVDPIVATSANAAAKIREYVARM